jgi:hypothetical protein
VRLAWIGVIMSLLFLLCWVYIFFGSWSTTRVWTAVRPTPLYVGLEEGPWDDTAVLVEQMERLYGAAVAYHRDFGQWPADPGVLVGRFLPHGFEMSGSLTYCPVPDSERQSYSWVLIVSDAVGYNVDGERLAVQHRLVCRLTGKVELLPVPEVATLLDAQSVDAIPAKPDVAASGNGD